MPCTAEQKLSLSSTLLRKEDCSIVDLPPAAGHVAETFHKRHPVWATVIGCAVLGCVGTFMAASNPSSLATVAFQTPTVSSGLSAATRSTQIDAGRWRSTGVKGPSISGDSVAIAKPRSSTFSGQPSTLAGHSSDTMVVSPQPSIIKYLGMAVASISAMLLFAYNWMSDKKIWLSAVPANSERMSLQAATQEAEGAQWDIEMFSPSKINLFLRIVRRREDGYHELASLFQAINLGDQIKFKVLPEGAEADEFDCNMPGVPTDSSNLVLKVVDLMRQRTGINTRLRVSLQKTVPAQAGLGGGSGNAATTFYAVNELFGRPATMEQLVEWSGELGSDITFFLSQGTAYCTGRGEILTPCDPLPPQHLYIFKPDIGLSTPSVFKALDLDALSKEDPLHLLSKFQEATPDVASASRDIYVNDLEPPAFSLVPELGALKEELLGYGFPHVLMSGSGTSVVAIGEPIGDLSGAEVVKKLDARADMKAFEADFIWRQGDDAEGNPQWY